VLAVVSVTPNFFSKMIDVYYWDNNKTNWENIIESYFRSLLVRELFIIIKK